MGMADGYAQASRRVAHVNLHTAPGVGNAMGALFNAQANKTPLLVTAGQQVRAHVTMQANLTNRDATRVPHPFVKWSYEPPRAEDVPAALARAIHHATLPPGGPAFVSIPMDDWDVEVDDADARPGDRAPRQRPRRGRPRGGARPGGAPGGGEEPGARRRARRRRISGALGGGGRAGRAPAPARVGDARARRRAHRLPRGPCPLPGRAAAGHRPGRPDARGSRPRARRRLVGLPLLPVHPRAGAPRGRDPGGHHQRPRRGGPRSHGRRAGGRRATHAGGARRGRRRVRPTAARAARRAAADPRTATRSTPAPSTRRWPMCLPDDGIVVLESPTSTMALRNRMRVSHPGSYYFGAGGGLGFGLAAGVGVQLAQPDRPVVCVLGEGSAQYAIPASGPPPPTTCRSRSWSCATTSTGSSSGSPRLEQVPARRGSTSRRSTSRGRDGLRGRAPGAWAGSRSFATRSTPAIASGVPRLVEVRWPRACRSSGRWRAAAPPAEVAAPTASRTALAAVRPSRCARELVALLGADRVLSRALDLVRYASDASPYRLIPSGRRDGARAGDVAKALAYARSTGTRSTPRRRNEPQRPGRSPTASWSTSAATSPASRAGGRRAVRVKPGTVLGHVNRGLLSTSAASGRTPPPRTSQRRRRDRQQLGRDALRRRPRRLPTCGR